MSLLFALLHRFTPNAFTQFSANCRSVARPGWLTVTGLTTLRRRWASLLWRFYRHQGGALRSISRRGFTSCKHRFSSIPLWVIILCAIVMAAGTAAGGWRIIRTLGHRMVKLQPVHGFAAETSAALIIQGASIVRHPAFNHARDLHLDHGSRRDETFQRCELGRGRENHLGVDFHPAGYRADRIHSGAGRCRVLTSETEFQNRIVSRPSMAACKHSKE